MMGAMEKFETVFLVIFWTLAINLIVWSSVFALKTLIEYLGRGPYE